MIENVTEETFQLTKKQSFLLSLPKPRNLKRFRRQKSNCVIQVELNKVFEFRLVK